MPQLSPAPPAPRLQLLASEPSRAAFEFFGGCLQLPLNARISPRGDGRPVLTLPGYGGADGSMSGMRRFLNRCGYRSFALGLGRNFDSGADKIRSVDDASRFRATMVDLIVNRVRQIQAETGEPVTLLGWSLGGVYAVDVSQRIPDLVRHVITLGSPFGDPRGTSLFYPMRRISGSTVPIEAQNFDAWNALQTLKTQQVPVSVLYSESDGIVGTEIARLKNDACVSYLPVRSSHVAFSFNGAVMRSVAREICRH